MGARQHRSALGSLSRETRHPLLPALLAQACGLVAVGLPTFLFFPALFANGLLLAMLQGGVAALVSAWMAAPPWWLAIHLAFLPLVVMARMLELPAALWAGGFFALLLVFWRTDRSRVPLYLSSPQAADVLLNLLPPGPCRVLDLGCGDASLLRRLARKRPESQFVGLEHAPLTWLWARVASGGLPNLSVRREDFWRHRLTGYDLVYAFLSPVPMARLRDKASAEMNSGAVLVSNSFPLPDLAEDMRIAVGDRAMSYFYVYRLRGGAV